MIGHDEIPPARAGVGAVVHMVMPPVELADAHGGPLAPFQNPAAVYLARLAEGSRRTMRHALDTLAGILTAGRADGPLDALAFPWAALGYEHTTALRAVVADRYAPATANKTLAALRGVLREAWRLGQMDGETMRRACDLAPVRGSRLAAGRALRAGELRALFQACADDPSRAGARDAALLAVLYGGGLRRAEVVTLALADYEAATGALRVRGKGNKERIAYLRGGAAEAVAAWLELRTAISPTSTGPLFVPIAKGDRPQVRRLTTQAVLVILQKRATEAGVSSFSPHDCRRTFIGDLLDAGADLATVQKLAGHANVQTTARYDRRGEAVKAAAAGLLHVPYVARSRRPRSHTMETR